jgi:hypothetical protein
MLVVIFIIATLVGLITGAAIKVLARAAETRTASEIGQLSAAVDNFKSSFKVKNPPDYIKLSTNANYPNRAVQGTLDYDSVQYLQSLWPRIDLTGATPLDWHGDLADGRALVVADYILEGDQCLVFFMGGIPTQAIAPALLPPGTVSGCTGFSTIPTNPTAAGGTRTTPFYDFKSNRLVLRSGSFFSYLDGFSRAPAPGQTYVPGVNGQPYVYLSSYKTANGYNRAAQLYGALDCSLMPNGAYFESTSPSTRFLRPDSFQIISAGANWSFGGGGQWTPATASSVYPNGSAGADDLSNFSDRALGVNN